MKSGNWKDVAEILGILAIVASLIFVGLQLKQSQDIAIAQQYQDRSATAVEWYVARMQSDLAIDLATLRLDADNPDEGSTMGIQMSLGDSDPRLIAQAYLEHRSNMTMFDNLHFQFEHGFMLEDAWRAFRTRLKVLLTNELNAEMYRQQSDQYRGSFQLMCSEILSEIASEQEE
jgi:hypothetical protein